MNSAEPGEARGLMVVKTTMDRAAVGPEIRCQEEPNRAAMMAGMMAA
jgi:hypothetical protein